MAPLKRTQVYFPEEMLEALRSKAKKEKTTIADIVRKAVSEILKREEIKDWDNDPLWNIVGAGSSQDGDLSVNHDTYLYGKNK